MQFNKIINKNSYRYMGMVQRKIKANILVVEVVVGDVVVVVVDVVVAAAALRIICRTIHTNYIYT